MEETLLLHRQIENRLLYIGNKGVRLQKVFETLKKKLEMTITINVLWKEHFLLFINQVVQMKDLNLWNQK